MSMKQINKENSLKKCLSIVIFGILLSFNYSYGFGSKTLFSTRSQSVNTVRELAGWEQQINKPGQDINYFTVAITPEYSHTFREKKISDWLFGCTPLIFSGSEALDSNDSDILADYFGLPSDFKSGISFDPFIINFLMDFDTYIGLDGVASGLYMRIHMPIVHTKWDLKLAECVTDPGTTFTSYPGGYLSSSPIELSTLTKGQAAPKNVKTAFEGNAVFGDMQEPLKYGKIFGRQTETRVGDLQLALGYNFLLGDWYHLGINIRGAAPTGTLRKAEFLFEPIAGNDHHWELGGGLSGHAYVWESEDELKKFGFFSDVNITHLFDSTQKRSYDLQTTCTINTCGNRYMLLQKMGSPVVGLNVGIAPNNQEPAMQYLGSLVPAINKTTLDSKIRINYQIDFVFKCAYTYKRFEFDLGYNLWARGEEKLTSRDCIQDCYAIKGDAQIYGFTSANSPVALNATQKNATIKGGQNGEFSGGNFSEGLEYANFNADNRTGASDSLGAVLNNVTSADANTFNVAQQSVQTSDPAILLKDCNIKECSGLLPSALSHKLFAYVGYTRPTESVTPYIGVGGFAEWGCICVANNSAASFWGVWLKGGVTY